MFFGSPIFANWLSSSEKFFCAGGYKTLLLKLPFNLKINNKQVSWEIKLPNNNILEMSNDGLSIDEMRDLILEPDALTFFMQKEKILILGSSFPMEFL